MTATEFINIYSNTFVEACAETHLFPSVKMAQAGIETGWGRSTIGPAKNMFGIKKGSTTSSPYWNGTVYRASTGEFINGRNVTISDDFRRYKTYSDSIRDHSYFLMALPRYQKVRDAKTPEDQCRALQTCGYATGQNYANSLISIINSNDLKRLDKRKAMNKTLNITIAAIILLAGTYYMYKAISY